MVHAAVGYARMRNRLGALACTSSIGPGATNMVTGAALATVNRLPVLLLPGDVFATHPADPVLQQLEVPARGDVSVNDAFAPVSRYFDRIWRAEQLIPAALAAMRVLTSPAETGAVTLALPQDVQAEAFDWPEEFLARARLACAARRARRGRAGAGGRGDPRREAAADRRGRRGHLQRRDRGAGAVRRCDRHPGRRDPGGPGVAAARQPAARRRGRRHRDARGEPARGGSRPRDRDRHPLDGLHDGVEHGVPAGAVRVGERRGVRLGEARRGGHGRRARGAGGARGSARGLGRRSRRTARRPSGSSASGMSRQTGCSRWVTGRCRRRAR